MSGLHDIQRIEHYFTRSAAAFDSLYSEEHMGPIERFLNKKFRSDIYERFVLSLNHVRHYKLESALDVGCGSGRYACALAQLGVRRVVGVDVSQKMIGLATKRASELPQAGGTFQFVCCAFEEFHTTETFDVVLAMGLFDYVKDPVSFLLRMQALANHSVIASFPSISFFRTPIRRVRYLIKRCPLYFYRPDQIASFAPQAGFWRHVVSKIRGAGMDYFVEFFKRPLGSSSVST